MHKILIVQTAYIGDVILATGLIESIHQAFPEAQIDFVTTFQAEAGVGYFFAPLVAISSGTS